MRARYRGLLVALLLLVIALPATAAQAASGLISLRVEAGFEGRAKGGEWVPVAVTVKNDGPDFEGIVQFPYTWAQGPFSQTAYFQSPVVIPSGATQRIEVVMPTEGWTGVPALEFIGKDGGEALRVIPQVESGWSLIVGVLGVETSELRSLGNLKIDEQPVNLVQMDAGGMPTDPLLLQNLDLLLLDRFAYSELTQAQRQAVEAWVEHGGMLVVAGGPEAARLEALSPWAPFAIKGFTTATVAGVGEAPIAQLDLSKGRWRVTWQSGDLPLVARHHKGQGELLLLAFDPALEPFATWSGLKPLFADLLSSRASQPWGQGGMPGPKQLAMFGDLLNNLPVLRLPATRPLLWTLGLYALLIGPVHLLLLRSFRRVGWAFLTLPVLALAGAGGAWAYAQRVAGTDLMLTAISVIDGQVGGSTLKVSSLVGMQMPPGSKHRINVGDALLTPMDLPYMPMPMGNGQSSQRPITIEMGRMASLPRTDQWGMRSVGATTFLPIQGTVEGGLLVTESAIDGRLTNRLPFGLKDLILVSGANFKRLGDLGPGESMDLSMNLFAASDQWGGRPIDEVIGRAFEVNGMWGPEGPSPEQQVLMRRQQMAWAALAGQNRAIPPVMLLGWAVETPLSIQVDGRAANPVGESLYVQPLEIAFAPEPMTVPASFLTPRPVTQGMAGAPGGFWPGWSPSPMEDVLIDFDLPFELVGRVDSVQAKLAFFGRTPSDNPPVTVSYYRWADETWVEAQVTFEEISAVQGGAFVNESGTIRIRIRATSEYQVPLGIPGMMATAKGEVQ